MMDVKQGQWLRADRSRCGAVAVVVLLVGASCSDGGSGGVDDASPAALAGTDFEVEDASAALLELEDLPDGWTTQYGPDVTGPEDGFVVLPCGEEREDLDDLVEIGTVVSHIDGDMTHAVNQGVRVHADAAAAQAVLDATAQARVGCETWEQLSGETVFELRLLADEVDVGPRGDAVDAYAVADNDGRRVTVTQIRCGPVISRVLLVEELGAPDGDLLSSALDAAEERLERVITAAGGQCG